MLWTRDRTHLAPAFPTPALRKNAKDGALHCVGNARKSKSPGHPACNAFSKSATGASLVRRYKAQNWSNEMMRFLCGDFTISLEKSSLETITA
jgi:hypothetical protein